MTDLAMQNVTAPPNDGVGDQSGGVTKFRHMRGGGLPTLRAWQDRRRWRPRV
jgi:hypothetical protein